jgi:hypothetical protein
MPNVRISGLPHRRTPADLLRSNTWEASHLIKILPDKYFTRFDPIRWTNHPLMFHRLNHTRGAIIPYSQTPL